MAIPPPITPSQYPDVPRAPGVPPLVREIGFIQDEVVLLIEDARLFLNLFSPPQWGIYLDGLPAIVGDNVVGFDYDQSYRVSNAPQEQGAFVSYNKVMDPFTGKVTFTKGGTIADRAAFLGQVTNALTSLGLYSLVMPEFTYASVNVVNQNFQRGEGRGVSFLKVEVRVEQVQVSGTSQFTNTVDPAAADPTNTGQVQATPPTASESAAIYEPT